MTKGELKKHIHRKISDTKRMKTHVLECRILEIIEKKKDKK